MEVYNTFVYTEGEVKDKFDRVVQKFDEDCLPKKNESFEWYVLRSRIQQPAESFDVFLMDLKLKARTCNFGVLQDSMLRDQIVFGIKDIKVQERLLGETELTLAGAMKVCHTSELAQQHAKTFSVTVRDAQSAAVAVVSTLTQKPRAAYAKWQKGTETSDCKRCGTRHSVKQCPANGKVCNKCKGLNHFAKQCFFKGKKSQSEHIQTVEETALCDTLFIGMMTQEESKMDKSQTYTEWSRTHG